MVMAITLVAVYISIFLSKIGTINLSKCNLIKNNKSIRYALLTVYSRDG